MKTYKSLSMSIFSNVLLLFTFHTLLKRFYYYLLCKQFTNVWLWNDSGAFFWSKDERSSA